MSKNGKLFILSALCLAVISQGMFASGKTDVPAKDQAVAKPATGAVYIPLISKGYTHQFWQAVKAGADQAAKDYNIAITFEGPESETMVDKQIDMLTAVIGKKPAAIGLAALDSQAVAPLLKKA